MEGGCADADDAHAHVASKNGPFLPLGKPHV